MNGLLSDPAPAEVRVVGIANGTDSSTVTIEWTPPTALVQYTTTTTPVPISNMSVTTTPPTTDPTQMDIIVEYNRDYTITVSIETCAGPRQTTTTVRIGILTYNTQYNIIMYSTSSKLFCPGVFSRSCAVIQYLYICWWCDHV